MVSPKNSRAPGGRGPGLGEAPVDDRAAGWAGGRGPPSPRGTRPRPDRGRTGGDRNSSTGVGARGSSSSSSWLVRSSTSGRVICHVQNIRVASACRHRGPPGSGLEPARSASRSGRRACRGAGRGAGRRGSARTRRSRGPTRKPPHHGRPGHGRPANSRLAGARPRRRASARLVDRRLWWEACGADLAAAGRVAK